MLFKKIVRFFLNKKPIFSYSNFHINMFVAKNISPKSLFKIFLNLVISPQGKWHVRIFVDLSKNKLSRIWVNSQFCRAVNPTVYPLKGFSWRVYPYQRIWPWLCGKQRITFVTLRRCDLYETAFYLTLSC